MAFRILEMGLVAEENKTMKLKNADKLILLLALTYFVSYVTRLDYSAVIAEMDYSCKSSG